MADEPVVVSKARPVKASNGVEGKTKPTFAIECKGASHSQKHGELRRGEVFFKCMKSVKVNLGLTSILTEMDTAQRLSRNVDAERDGPSNGVVSDRSGRLPLC